MRLEAPVFCPFCGQPGVKITAFRLSAAIYSCAGCGSRYEVVAVPGRCETCGWAHQRRTELPEVLDYYRCGCPNSWCDPKETGDQGHVGD